MNPNDHSAKLQNQVNNGQGKFSHSIEVIKMETWHKYLSKLMMETLL